MTPQQIHLVLDKLGEASVTVYTHYISLSGVIGHYDDQTDLLYIWSDSEVETYHSVIEGSAIVAIGHGEV